MGMYDEVELPCPKCGAKSVAQSKGGECELHCYEDINKAPAYVLGYLTWPADKFKCESCGREFVLKAKFWTEEVRDQDE